MFKNLLLLSIFLLFFCKQKDNYQTELLSHKSLEASLYFQNQIYLLYEQKNTSCFSVSLKNKTFQTISSGFFITEDGYGITSANNLDEKKEYIIRHNGTASEYPIKILSINKKYHLALIFVKDIKDFSYIDVPFQFKPKTGTLFFSISSTADNFFETMLNGYVSKNLRANVDSLDLSFSFIQIDSAIEEGMQGSPAFSIDGKLLGILHKIEKPNYSGNYGFLIPISDLNSFLFTHSVFREKKFILQKGIHEIPILTAQLVEKLKLKHSTGILVSYVDKDSPAEKAGIQRYDLILKIEEEPINNRFELYEAFKKYSQKKTLYIEIFRDGKIIQFKIL